MNFRFLFALLLILPATAMVGQGNGQYNFQVLQAISPARIAALGGNSIAVKDGDINLGLVAPSLLDSSSAGQVALGYTRFFGEANIAHAAYAHHFSDFGTVTFSLKNLGYGEFEMTDETGTVIGNFNAGEYVFQAGLGRRLSKDFSLGANVKYILSELASYNASAIAVDLSTTYHKPEKQFAATFLLKNIGSSISSYRDGEGETLPFEVQLGLSKKLAKAPLRFQLIGHSLQQWDLTPEANDEIEIDPLTGEAVNSSDGGFGENLARHIIFNTEVIIGKNFFLRFGYNYNRRQQLKIEDRPGAAGLTYGIGMRIAKIHISYARAAYSLAGVSNHFGLSVKFDDFRKTSK